MIPTLLLSYDLEEFDMPLEFGGHLSFEEQIAASSRGLEILLVLLNKYDVKATFYCTAQYALAMPAVVKKLHAVGHEIASHTFYHSAFKNEDLKNSKDVLEGITQHTVHGLRMPRMMAVEMDEVRAAGYSYNSSLNPTWIPGRYNHFFKPRTCFYEQGVLQVPASVTPVLRFPLFWLALHNFPLWFYIQCCSSAIKKDGYLNLYFHPWEFIDYTGAGGANFPQYVTRNCGVAMVQRTEALLKFAVQKKFSFSTTFAFLQQSNFFNLNQSKEE